MLRTSINGLSKTLTASALTLTIALTGITATATPAAANGHRNNQGAQAAAVFGGLLLLYGISQAGRNNGNRNAPAAVQQPQPQPQVQYPPRPHFNHRVAPAQCFVQVGHGNQRVRGYDYHCMQTSVRNAQALPQDCLRNIWTIQGQRTIYNGQCLANNGWSRG